VLVVGGGPAGLECARALGQRGYSVVLAEARKELDGRVVLEANLPGLSEWRRVVDWRLTQIQKMGQVSVYPASVMSAEDIQETSFTHLLIATGAQWRRDGVGRTHWRPIPGHDLPSVFTPDDILADRLPTGQILVYDDDHYYMGGLIAELLSSRGCVVTLVTPAPLVSHWTQYTLEQERIQAPVDGEGCHFVHSAFSHLDSTRPSHLVLKDFYL
jgi:dimethylamine/trimethylamine dehydrogenase